MWTASSMVYCTRSTLGGIEMVRGEVFNMYQLLLCCFAVISNILML